jgi:hypothetical protein
MKKGDKKLKESNPSSTSSGKALPNQAKRQGKHGDKPNNQSSKDQSNFSKPRDHKDNSREGTDQKSRFNRGERGVEGEASSNNQVTEQVPSDRPRESFDRNSRGGRGGRGRGGRGNILSI